MLKCSRFTRLVARCLLLLAALSLDSACFAGNSDFDSGMKCLKAGDYAGALPGFDRSVDAEPTNAEYHYWRGKCLSAMSKDKEAAAEFKLACLLAGEGKIKDGCKRELARYKQTIPKGSVHGNSGGTVNGANIVVAGDDIDQHDRFFKLSSKKLEWNLTMSRDFLQSMNARTENLANLARGRNWRIPASAALNGPAFDVRTALQDGPAHFSVPLTAEERRSLINSDIMIILDHSGSMRTLDCPSATMGVEPRLLWCTEELDDFAENLAAALPHGFHLITFDSKPDVFRISNAAELRRTLQSLTGGGGTDLASALKEAFRLHTAHPVQPLLIAVVSDAEIDLHSCEQTIVQATKQFPLPNGVFITLLQVGIIAETHTADRLSALDNLGSRSGADYDAFVAVPFSKLRREGLGRDLLIGLRLNNKTVPAPSTAVPH